jgi:hypothetical protein
MDNLSSQLYKAFRNPEGPPAGRGRDLISIAPDGIRGNQEQQPCKVLNIRNEKNSTLCRVANPFLPIYPE